MAKNAKQLEERYLKVPFHILNHPGLNDGERWLLAWLYSFGGRGCWQSNEQLSEVLYANPRSITRRIAKLDRLNLLHMRAPKSAYRCIWVKSHPEVEAAAAAWGKVQHGQKCPSNIDKNVQVDRQKCPGNIDKKCSQHGQKCPPTIRDYKSTIKETTAPPSPLPARGQAQAVLEHRQEQQQASTKKFMTEFGKEFKICPIKKRREIRKNLSKKHPFMAAS